MPEQFVKVKEQPYKEMQITSKEAFTDSVKHNNDFYKCDTDSNYSNSIGDICRICHCEADAENPLLSPCYCSGSLKYVHQSCLRQWLAASDSRTCELCKFNFILHTKIKPLSEWRILEMSSVEKRKLMYVVSFNFVAAVCVIWSLFVLIDRTAEEFRKGVVGWPFWTKLAVVAVGFTGGAVFMYLYCKKYMMLLSRWRAHNRIILVQNAPERPTIISQQQQQHLQPITTNPNFSCSKDNNETVPIVITQPNAAAVAQHPLENYNVDITQENNAHLYMFLNNLQRENELNHHASEIIQKADVHVEDLCETPKKIDNKNNNLLIYTNDGVFELGYLKAREFVALDIDCLSTNKKFFNPYKTDDNCGNGACKSSPNLLNSSYENLLV